MLLTVFSWIISPASYANPVTVTDIAGRQVVLKKPAERIILADARALQALQIVHPDDPFKGIIAWDNSLKNKAPDLYKLYKSAYPNLSKLPILENAYLSDFSVEKVVGMNPDLIIFDYGVLAKLKESQVLPQLEKIGIPVMFIDFRLRPLTNTVSSIRILGQALGETEGSEAYIRFYQQRLALINQRVSTLAANQRPSVFIERHAGMTGEECCFTFGKGSFGEFIQAAGGVNMGSALFAGKSGTINLEQLITSNPAFYLMTGADWSDSYKESIGVPLGYNADVTLSHQRLDKLMARNGVNVLQAIKNRQVMAIYHQFYDSPLNILAVESIAKFLHPELFKDLNPQADAEAIHQQFLAQPFSGLFWLSASTDK
nr:MULTISPECIES: ABC transporter substrate-binding protein [Erwiniaceae]